MSKSFAVIRNTAVRGATLGLGALAASLLATPSQAALVSACTGVSLPKSVVTGIISGPLTGIATPIQTTVNNLLLGLTGLPVIGAVLNPRLPAPLSIDVTGLINTAVTGDLTLQALATDGTVIGPGVTCNTTASSYQLDTPAGIAVGGNSITGLGGGAAASAGTIGSIAFGNGASTSAAATDSIALGARASATAANSIAIGADSTATRGALVGYTAPGVTGPQTSAGEVSVGRPGFARQITNVAPGSQPTDAVNLAQVTTAITGASAAVAIQYSNPGTPTTPNGGFPTNSTTLVGGAAGPVALHNVAPGQLAAGSTDAVNGDQLFATNTAVTTNTTNINNVLGGTAGIVKQTGGYPGGGQITIGADSGGANVSVAGQGGDRTLTGVLAGVGSNDAVNVSQLTAVAATAANAVQYDTVGGVRQNSVTLSGGAPGPVEINNLAAGTLAAGSTDAVNGGQLFATNTGVGGTVGVLGGTYDVLTGAYTGPTYNTVGATTATTVQGAFDNYNTAIGGLTDGTLGLVQQAGPGAPITVGVATDGTVVNFNGTAGDRTLTGVLAGVANNDAVNVGQLNAVAATAVNAVQYDTVGGVRQNSVTLTGGAPGTVSLTNLSAGTLSAASTDAVNGSQLFATNTGVGGAVGVLGGTYNVLTGAYTGPTYTTVGATTATTVQGAFDNYNTAIGGLTGGTLGLVQQAGPGAPITVGAATDGTQVSFLGTAGVRRLTNVAEGVAGSDAATVSQLAAVTGGALNAVQYDVVGGTRQNSITLEGGAPGTVSLTNLSAGGLSAASTDAVNGSQLFATNTGVGGAVGVLGGTYNVLTGAYTGPTYTTVGATTATTVQGAFDNYNTAIDGLTGGTLGLVQQTGPGAPITVGAATDGTVVNITGTAGDRTLTGVLDGVANNDAATVGQLSTVAAVANNAVQYDTVGGVRQNSITLAGGAPGTVSLTNLSAGVLSAASTDAVNGSQLFATNTGIGGAVGVLGGTYNVLTGAYTGPTYTTAGATTATTVQGAFDNYNTAIDGLTGGTLGLVQQAGPGAPITVGVATDGTVVDFTGTAGTRTLTGVSAGALGAASTDAVNGSQVNALATSLANSLGGGSTFNTVTGAISAPSYTVQGSSYNNAGSAFGAIDTALNNISSGTVGPVQQTGAPNSLALVAPGGTGAAPGAPQSLTNVAAATISATSTGAVNGSQLFATQAGIGDIVTVVGGTYDTTTGAYTGPTYNTAGGTSATSVQTAFNNYNTAIDNLTNGSAGLVQQAGPGAPITVGAATDGTSVNFAGTGGTRVLSGLSNGVLGSDAATVAQLAAVTGGALNAVNYDTVGGTRQNSITLVGGAAGPVTINNVADGTVAAGSTQAVNGGQLAATNAQVTNITNGTANAGAFRSDNTAGAAPSVASGADSSAGGFGSSATGSRSLALGNGSTSSGTNSVSLGANSTDGGQSNVVSIGGVGSERRLTNVGPGLNGTDAVNLSQLQAATASFQTTTNGLQSQINQLDFDLGKAKRRANAGTAGALAIAGLPQPFTEGAGMVAGGVGYWQGQVAFAVGVSKIVSDTVIVKAGASVSGRGTAGGNAGVGFQF